MINKQQQFSSRLTFISQQVESYACGEAIKFIIRVELVVQTQDRHKIFSIHAIRIKSSHCNLILVRQQSIEQC